MSGLTGVDAVPAAGAGAADPGGGAAPTEGSEEAGAVPAAGGVVVEAGVAGGCPTVGNPPCFCALASASNSLGGGPSLKPSSLDPAQLARTKYPPVKTTAAAAVVTRDKAVGACFGAR